MAPTAGISPIRRFAAAAVGAGRSVGISGAGLLLWENGHMKTTVELPDALFRRAKSAAAEQGQSLKDFFAQAVQNQLQRNQARSAAKPWEKAFGGLRDLHRDNLRISKIIEEEFETIDEEQWR